MTAPITHARALDLAGAVPAFPLDPPEDLQLRTHLGSCPDCARHAAGLRADSRAIGRVDPPISPVLHDRIREVAVSGPRSRPGALGALAILVLLGVGVVGASIGVGGFLSARPATAEPSTVAQANDAVHWRTDVVDLAARTFTIDANGVRFTGVPSALVQSDPGSLTRWTLEVSWTEQHREQRVNLEFKADGASWWIDQVLVRDGAADRKADWARLPAGPWARTPLGQVFAGDLDLEGTSATGPVKVHLGGVRIAVRPHDTVTEPIGGGITLAGEAANPFRPGGALYCSGLLQRTPQELEASLLQLGYRLSWRWDYATGANTGFAEPRAQAPTEGYVAGANVGMDGELIVFVEDPGRPVMPAATFPPACATPSP